VISNCGRQARAPYALPYVSLRARAKIPAEAELEISRIIWQANVRFYTGLDITLNDCDIGLQKLAEDGGWSSTTPMEQYCQWHVDRLLEPDIG
jgi:hypothetical protein